MFILLSIGVASANVVTYFDEDFTVPTNSIVTFGFDECTWCQEYTPLFVQAAEQYDGPLTFVVVRMFDDFDEEEPTNESETFDMYNSPVLIKDGVLAYDESNDRTSLINDEVRVYKGGSWKDREYWLDPAQRRYYPQDMATDYIGFRCAMSRVGSKSLSQKKKKN